MDRDLSTIEWILEQAVPMICPAAQLHISWQGHTIFARAVGAYDSASRLVPVDQATLFDLASLSKLFVVTAGMVLLEQGQLSLDQPLDELLPHMTGRRPLQPDEHALQLGLAPRPVDTSILVDVGQITLRQILTHTAGLPAWRPLFRAGSPSAVRQLLLASGCTAPPGSALIYSDIGLMLLGLLLERLCDQPLDRLVADLVILPAGLPHTCYLPIGQLPPPNVAPTGWCAWRGRQLAGEVHDENAAALGGVAGHAGLFATASALVRFGQMFLAGGQPILHPASIVAMTRCQAESGSQRRGLGFALWSPDPTASGHPFSQQAFGHTGFTGTSLWIDPARQLVVALLTNDIVYGRTDRRIADLRLQIHRAIVDIVDHRPARLAAAADSA